MQVWWFRIAGICSLNAVTCHRVSEEVNATQYVETRQTIGTCPHRLR